MLLAVTSHLRAPASGHTHTSHGSSMPQRDHYGNLWEIADSQRHSLTVTPAQTGVAQDVDPPIAPGWAPTAVAIDDHGFIWAASGAQIFFINPR